MRALAVGVALLAGALTGCASGPVGQHQPSLELVQSLRASGMSSLNVGEFTASEQLPKGRNKSVSARGHTLSSPSNGSFASYLRDSLIAELRAAGKYDAGSTTVVSGKLIHNELNAAGVSTADAKLSAQFAVSRAGAVVYDKRLDAAHQWKSSFVGAVAIPAAINEYTDMYTKLLRRLFEDPEFMAATKRK